MKKQFIRSNIFFSMIITVFLLLTFVLSVPAQKISRGNLSTIAEDTSTYPHDFNDDYYIKNGVSPKFIIERRTGTDYLSVFGLTSDPRHRSVRVLVTLPAYGQNGEMLFWTPLGELREDGFTEDGIGMQAREAANTYPIYVFPKFSDPSLFAFTNVRQSALIDRTQEGLLPEPYSNVLGVRVIVLVNYTEKAFNTKEGVQMMQYMAKKNGLSLEGTPLIKTKSDLDELAKYECISMQKRVFWDDSPYRGIYAISPIIIEPVKQAIAGDAFLFMVTKDGKPLDSESAFAAQFACLQKTGEWCSE